MIDQDVQINFDELKDNYDSKPDFTVLKSIEQLT
jgi:hypothetical protein